MGIGAQIQRAMEANNKIAADVARFLGITESAVSQWFGKDSGPRSKRLKLLATYFNTTVEWLLSDEPWPTEAFESVDLAAGIAEASTPFAGEPAPSVITELGRLVIVWNGVEALLRSLVAALSKDPVFVRVLIVHMSTIACCDAIRVWANDHAEEMERDRLLHAIRFVETVREFRNHYVHGMIGVPGSNDDAYTEAFAMTGEEPVARKTRARANYQVLTRPLKLSEVRASRKHAATLLTFLLSLNAHFQMAGIDDDEVKARLPPLPDKPPLPGKLQMQSRPP